MRGTPFLQLFEKNKGQCGIKSEKAIYKLLQMY